MGDYTGNAWDESNPANGHLLSEGAEDIREFKAQIAEMFDRQHSIDRNIGSGEEGTDALAANGMHRVGATGVLAVDSTTNLDDVTLYNEEGDTTGADKVTGAIAYDATKQVLVYYNGSNWIPMAPYIAYQSQDKSETITSSPAYMTNVINAETVAGLIVGDIIKVTFWGAFLQSTVTSAQVSLWFNDVLVSPAFTVTGGEGGIDRVTLKMSVAIAATDVTHDIDIKAQSIDSESLTGAGCLVEVYPQGIS